MVDYIRCAICGKPHILTQDEYEETNGIRPKSYICVECIESFETDYILHRIECEKMDIYSNTFWNLEHRLAASISKDHEDGYIGVYIMPS